MSLILSLWRHVGHLCWTFIAASMHILQNMWPHFVEVSSFNGPMHIGQLKEGGPLALSDVLGWGFAFFVCIKKPPTLDFKLQPVYLEDNWESEKHTKAGHCNKKKSMASLNSCLLNHFSNWWSKRININIHVELKLYTVSISWPHSLTVSLSEPIPFDSS